jgi:TolA-binding protein
VPPSLFKTFCGWQEDLSSQCSNSCAQKVLLPTPTKPRTTFKCVNRRDPNEDRRIINEQAEQLISSRNKISKLEHVVETLEQKNQEYEEEISKLKEKVQQCDFSIDQFKSNDIEFEFYTPAFPIMVHLKLSITICVQHVKGYSILDRQKAQTKL